MGTVRRGGILSEAIDLNGPPKRRPAYPSIPATIGMDITHQATGTIGRIIAWSDAAVTLRDDSGQDRQFRNMAGSFLHNGAPCTLVRPAPLPAEARRLTASGSIALDNAPAKMARASRLLVEGIHDAELIEKVWGDDLRSEGIVVVPMDGADDLATIVSEFGPRPGRRLGVLLDHLVDHTKESRIAAAVNHPEVLIRGHKFIDIWAAIDPKLAGLSAWPEGPRSIPWKEGICAAVGVEESWKFWKQLLASTTSFRDLHPSLVGAVEELIDFVTAPSMQ